MHGLQTCVANELNAKHAAGGNRNVIALRLAKHDCGIQQRWNHKQVRQETSLHNHNSTTTPVWICQTAKWQGHHGAQSSSRSGFKGACCLEMLPAAGTAGNCTEYGVERLGQNHFPLVLIFGIANSSLAGDVGRGLNHPRGTALRYRRYNNVLYSFLCRVACAEVKGS